jgi:hypothetical protein
MTALGNSEYIYAIAFSLNPPDSLSLSLDLTSD